MFPLAPALPAEHLALSGVGVALSFGQPREVVGGVPVNTSPPSLSNPSTPQIGVQEDCNPGTWLPLATGYHYQWQVNGSNVGTDASSYTPGAGDDGGTLACIVTAYNGAGNSLPASSTNSSPITYPPPVNTVSPVITDDGSSGGSIDSPNAGDNLNGDNGTWLNSPTSFAYAWKSAGVIQGPATSGPYTVQSYGDETGKQILLTVIATNDGGSVSADSNLSGPVNPP